MRLDAKIARALSHPIRVQVLEMLERDEASPVMMARRMDGVALGLVSYHVGVLEECGLVELVRTEPRRGAVEHFYRPQPAPIPDLDGVPRSLRRSLAAASLQHLVDSAVEALEAGTIGADRDEAIGTMAIGIDATGWEEAQRLSRDLIEEMRRIHRESIERAGGEQDRPRHAMVALACFELAPPGGRTS